jgi:hypothetical protein
MQPFFALASLPLVTLSASLPASSFWPGYQSKISAWAPLPPHTPSFHVVQNNVTHLGFNGTYKTMYYEIRDSSTPNDGVVAVYIPGASENVEGWKQGMDPELNLLVPLPSLAPDNLPALPRYGWAWLFGAKVVTIPWLDCCQITGDNHSFSFSVGNSPTLTLTESQSWVPAGNKPGRDAVSTHTFTLVYDEVVGYRIDIVTALRINAKAAPPKVEFVNFLTPHLANPWPYPNTPDLLGGPRSNTTAWTANMGDTWEGFAENLLAGAMLHTYNISTLTSGVGAVSMLSPGGFSATLAHGPSEGGIQYFQATCPTWMDQHQVLLLPPPGGNGYITLAPTFSLAYLPPSASLATLGGGALTLVTHTNDGSRGNGTGVLLRIGVVEDFASQPMPLTSPQRGLVKAYYSPDYAIVGAGEPRGGKALKVPALPPSALTELFPFANPQPLIPLNASTAYILKAALLPPFPCLGGFARLAVKIYEDDDFNTPARLFNFTSPNATGEAWVDSEVSFTSPPWVSYADLEFQAFASGGNCSALFADVYFGLM